MAEAKEKETLEAKEAIVKDVKTLDNLPKEVKAMALAFAKGYALAMSATANNSN